MIGPTDKDNIRFGNYVALYACRFTAPKEAVRLVLQLYPDQGRFGVSRPDKKGRTPLWYAVRYEYPPGVQSLLLQVNPSTVLEEDPNSETPLALVWDEFGQKMDGKRTLNRIIGTGTRTRPGMSMDDSNSNSCGCCSCRRCFCLNVAVAVVVVDVAIV